MVNLFTACNDRYK